MDLPCVRAQILLTGCVPFAALCAGRNFRRATVETTEFIYFDAFAIERVDRVTAAGVNTADFEGNSFNSFGMF